MIINRPSHVNSFWSYTLQTKCRRHKRSSKEIIVYRNCFLISKTDLILVTPRRSRYEHVGLFTNSVSTHFQKWTTFGIQAYSVALSVFVRFGSAYLCARARFWKHRNLGSLLKLTLLNYSSAINNCGLFYCFFSFWLIFIGDIVIIQMPLSEKEKCFSIEKYGRNEMKWERFFLYKWWSLLT